MYRNLRAEFTRSGKKFAEASDHLGIALTTFSTKMNGKSDWTFGEASELKRFLGCDLPLEELFEKGEEQ